MTSAATGSGFTATAVCGAALRPGFAAVRCAAGGAVRTTTRIRFTGAAIFATASGFSGSTARHSRRFIGSRNAEACQTQEQSKEKNFQ